MLRLKQLHCLHRKPLALLAKSNFASSHLLAVLVHGCGGQVWPGAFTHTGHYLIETHIAIADSICIMSSVPEAWISYCVSVKPAITRGRDVPGREVTSVFEQTSGRLTLLSSHVSLRSSTQY